VNLETCLGMGLCELHAPAAFEVTDGGYATVLLDEIKADQQDAVRSAAAQCPTGSISIIE